jgi:tRNA pseudouridine55 synthase
VAVHELELKRSWLETAPTDGAVTDGTGRLGLVELAVRVTKGYYVRSLARDLGGHLGLPAHLASLRRTASGPFDLAHAVSLADDARHLRSALLPLERAAALALPSATLTELGAYRASCGQQLAAEHFVARAGTSHPSAWFDGAGRLVAIGRMLDDGSAAVLRGFSASR